MRPDNVTDSLPPRPFVADPRFVRDDDGDDWPLTWYVATCLGMFWLGFAACAIWLAAGSPW